MLATLRSLATVSNNKRFLTKMSYRDLRNFTEMMRSLGYTRLVSMENFRNPNFPLVAEILVWLVERIDPSAGLTDDIAEESDRVHLIRTSAHILALKAGLKLNTKKLYQADGYAVKELMKVASLLYNSLNVDEQTTGAESLSVVDTVLKTQEASTIRQQVADITAAGAALFDLLGQEPELRELRQSRAARPLELSQVESAVTEEITNVTREMSKTRDLIDNVVATEASLDSKIEKKKSDLERHSKRLQALKKMRPAFMDEFEKVESELKVLYEEYVVKSMNLGYLESVLEQTLHAENARRETKQASARRILEDVKRDEDSVDASEILEEKKPVRKTGKARGATTKVKKSFGSMIADETDSLDDSDSDLLLDGDITDDEDPKSFKDLSEDDF